MKPSNIRRVLPRLIAKKRAVFIWGPPGVGKSDVIGQIADDMDLELRDVRLSLLDPVDLKGFPTIGASKKEMVWLPADFLPKDPKSKGLLFLDEMNSAVPAVQATAYQLVLNRRIGDYRLPDGWAVVSAGNRMGDRSVTHAMPAALANRFVHLDFDVSPEDWDNWAVDNNIHPDLRAFLRFRPAQLHNFDPTSNPRAFPSPRSWAFINDIYKNDMAPDEEFELIKGTIGEGAAAEYLAFIKLIKDLPTVEQVLADPEGTPIPTNPGSVYAIALALESKATAANFAKIMKYITRMTVEYQVVFIRGVIRRDEKLAETKSYKDWGIANQKMFV